MVTCEEIAGTGLRRSMKILGYFGDVAATALLLESDPSLADDPGALHAAAVNRHEAFVRLLLRHQPDLARRVTVSRPREMAELLFSHGMEHEDVVRLLTEFERTGALPPAR